MEKDIAVYVSVLHDSLRDKCKVLQEILKLTKEQQELLCREEMDFDAFDALMQDKEVLIQRMQELDRGFQNLFDIIGDALKEDSGRYKAQILEMQNDIREITDCSVKIQALEQKNKEKFTASVAKKRREIRDFKVSNKTAVSYYQNMANQHHEWQSYFVDKKK